MQLAHEFHVPVPVADAWTVLLDIERIAPCMPGAAVTSATADDFTGTVKVKVGPITVTYNGKASFTKKDADAHQAVIEARGKETRGTGTAQATITAALYDAGDDATRVTVLTDLAITGKPAQFGRGVMADVGAKLLGQFADCLEHQLAGRGGSAAAAPVSAAAPGGSGGAEQPGEPAPRDEPFTAPLTAAVAARPTADTIDLLETAGMPVLKRLAPVLAAVAALVAVLVVVRRRRS